MKLELKNIAPYLPFGLMALNTAKGERIKVNVFKALLLTDNEGVYKPILRPLSDLIKEIEIDGKKFIPIVELAKLFHSSEYEVTDYIPVDANNDLMYYVKCYVEGSKSRFMYYGLLECINNNKYKEIQKLIEWHFDIFGLIDAGLSIDINTL